MSEKDGGAAPWSQEALYQFIVETVRATTLDVERQLREEAQAREAADRAKNEARRLEHLRDLFAGQALPKLIDHGHGDPGLIDAARMAYRAADAMLLARAARSTRSPEAADDE